MKKIFIILIVILSLPVLVIEGDTFAPTEDETSLVCGQEIPTGEAMTLTNDFLTELRENIEHVQRIVREMRPIQLEMNEMALECDIKNCDTDCRMVSCGLNCSICVPFSCYEHPCLLRDEINDRYESLVVKMQELKHYQEKIDDMFTKDQIDLCDKTNIDILSTSEKFQCWNRSITGWIPLIGSEILITRPEHIQRKVNSAREYLRDCNTNIGFSGEVTEDHLENLEIMLSCYEIETFMGEIKLESKTSVQQGRKKIPVCTDNHNWFCCK